MCELSERALLAKLWIIRELSQSALWLGEESPSASHIYDPPCVVFSLRALRALRTFLNCCFCSLPRCQCPRDVEAVGRGHGGCRRSLPWPSCCWRCAAP